MDITSSRPQGMVVKSGLNCGSFVNTITIRFYENYKSIDLKKNLELTRPYTIAYERIEAVENVFVLLQADNGMVGVGSASPDDEVTGETIQHCQQILEQEIEAILLGADLRYFSSLLRQLASVMTTAPAALAATDIALHDLAARQLNLPLVSLLGQVHKGLPTSVTIGILPVEETLKEAREFVAQGFPILKVKTGLELDVDIERMVKLREEVGTQVKLRVDANQGYSVSEYREFYEKTKTLNLEFVEQPLKATNLDGMRSLEAEIRLRTTADESLLGPASAIDCLATPRPFGIFNIKLMKCGGIAPAREVATMAEYAGIDLMWGCNDESIISISAALLLSVVLS